MSTLYHSMEIHDDRVQNGLCGTLVATTEQKKKFPEAISSRLLQETVRCSEGKSQGGNTKPRRKSFFEADVHPTHAPVPRGRLSPRHRRWLEPEMFSPPATYHCSYSRTRRTLRSGLYSPPLPYSKLWQRREYGAPMCRGESSQR